METENENKRNGWIGTIIVHSLLFLVFLFTSLKTPIEEPPPEGILINFGNASMGRTSNIPDNDITKDELVESPENEIVEIESNISESKDNIILENSVNITEIKKKEDELVKDKQKEEAQEKEQKEEVRKPNPDALFPSSNTSQKSGEGVTKYEKDQGSQQGDVNASNYSNKESSGKGISYSLSGRKMIKDPEIKDNSQESGVVVVDIRVDKYGKIISAIPGSRGSTTTSSYLYKLAKEATLNKKLFDANPDAPEIQKGSITYVFIVE